MNINKWGNENIYLIPKNFIGGLFLILPLLWMNVFPPSAYAQKKIKNADPFLDNLAKQNQLSRWRPLNAPGLKNNPNADMNDPENLQALTYLQGYSPPTKFRNVTLYDQNRSFHGYNLLVSAHAPEATLMDMNGKPIHQWHYPSASLPGDHRHYADYWVSARILKGGDLLALIPYSGLLKIDKKSRLIWFRRIICHHDFDIDGNENIYTLTVKNSKLKDNAGMKIDSIAILSPKGEIKKEISLYGLLKKYPGPAYINKINSLAHMKDFFYSDDGDKIYLSIPGDAFHSNSIQVLDGKWASKSPSFKKGNLLVSIRNIGVIICVDPDKKEIVWLMDTAFWNKGQHFAKLLDNGNILIFDNLYRHNLSRVVEFDPAAKKIAWDYSGQNGLFFSFIVGQCYRLPIGNTLITESANGHSFEVTPNKKIVWEFYNPNQIDRENNKLIAIIYQMQRIPIDSAMDWLKN